MNFRLRVSYYTAKDSKILAHKLSWFDSSIPQMITKLDGNLNISKNDQVNEWLQISNDEEKIQMMMI